MLTTFLDAYFYCVLRQPLLSLLMVIGLAIALASHLPDLKIDASSDSLTLEYDKDLDYFREVSERYNSGDFLVVTYKPKGELLAADTLIHLRALRDELLTVEGVDSANSILDVPLLYSPPVSLTEVARGVKTLADGQVDLTLVEHEFMHSPIYKNMLLGPDKKTTAILLNLDVDKRFIDMVRSRDALRLKRDTQGLSDQEASELEQVSQDFLVYSTEAAQRSYQRVTKVRSVVERYRGEADIFLGGVSMITADMVDFIRSDITVFGAGIIIFIIIMLSVIFRQWQFVMLPLVTCLLTLIVMLGYLAAVDWRLTVISSNFVALLLIVCLAITIHLLVRYREFSNQMSHVVRAQNLRDTVTAMFQPCLYTVLTTLVAFVSLVVSGIRPVIDFGWMMAMGLCVAFAMSFIVIPAGLMLLPKTRPNYKEDQSAVLTLRFSRFTERHGRLILFLGMIAVCVSVMGIKRLKVENRFIDYFHSSTEIYQGMLVIDRQLGGTITLDITLDALEEEASAVTVAKDDDLFAEDIFADDDPFAEGDPFAQEPIASAVQPTLEDNVWFTQMGMDKIEAVHDYLDSLSEVGKVQSLAVAYKVARDLNKGRSLNDFELALMRKALPEEINNFLIKPYLAADREQTRLSMRIKETDPNLRRDELLQKIHSDLITRFDLAPEQVKLTGVLVLYNNLLQSLFRSQILTIGAVFFGILLMFLILFRSFSLSLIALIPNMLAALVVLGGMGLARVPLDMMTITIAAIAVGIGVDNAIHYIYRFRKEFSVEKNYIKAMHNAHGSIGRAMFYTSITIIAGFSILSLSAFIPSIYFGLLTGLAMFAAILASLTLLPQLIILLKPLGKADGG
ncbi:MAG: MMPL family transporter [Cellvibrionaceae bacterium]|nr:MMPL family transporter [Cellvibrionaceae bacterium]